MKQTTATFFTSILLLLLTILFAACQRNTVSPNVGSTPQVAPTVAEATASNDTESPTETTEPPPSAGLCSIVNAQDVQTITSVAYDTTNTQGDFPNIKHCEYRGQANVVSLVIANGSTATERMSNNKLVPHTTIAGFQDETIWEPIQNLLSVMSGGRLVEVRISKSHGDEATRIEHAKALALVLLSR